MSEDMCYCAICGAVLNDDVAIGSIAPGDLVRRRDRVRRIREGIPLTDESTNGNGSRDRPENWHREDEDRSLDPALVNEDSLFWLTEVECVGYNPDAPGDPDGSGEDR